MQALVSFAIIVAFAAILALPAAVAILRRHPSWIAISCLTALLGWTGLGWIAALLWARGSISRRRRSRAPWIKSLWAATTSARTRPARRAVPDALPMHAGANDNASVMRAATAEILPDVIASDPYEDWLEHGEALQDDGDVATAGSTAGLAA